MLVKLAVLLVVVLMATSETAASKLASYMLYVVAQTKSIIVLRFRGVEYVSLRKVQLNMPVLILLIYSSKLVHIALILPFLQRP